MQNRTRKTFLPGVKTKYDGARIMRGLEFLLVRAYVVQPTTLRDGGQHQEVGR
jgi:hypothetical protein